MTLSTYVLVVLVTVLPFWNGVMESLRFHSERTGGGLTLHQLIYLHDTLVDAPSLWLQVGLSPAVGSVTLAAALILSYWWIWRARPHLLPAFIVVLSAFLLGSKLVNEQFAVWLVPFLLLVIAADDSKRHRWSYTALTLLPLVFMTLRVPLTDFLHPLVRLGVLPVYLPRTAVQTMFGTSWHATVLSVLAVGFVVLLLAIVLSQTRGGKRWAS
jgi:hypothetical protein